MGPTRNGVASETGIIKSFTSSGPAVLWSAKLGEGFGAAAIVGGKVYILDREADTEDIMRCYDLATGKVEWKTSYTAPGKTSFNGSRCVPAVDETYVFSVGQMGQITCFERATGKQLWQKSISDDYGVKLPNWGFAQCPVIYKNTVIIGVQGNRAGVVAFDKATGNEAWSSRTLSGGVGYVSPMVYTIDGVDQVVMISARGKSEKGEVVGFNAENGRELWTYDGWQCSIPIGNALHLGNGKLFITGGYKAGSVMIQVSGSSVNEVFKLDFETCGAQVHLPLVIGEYMYLFSNSNERKDGMTCISLTGDKKWNTGKTPNFGLGGSIFIEGQIWAVDGDTGKLHIIDPSPDGYKEVSSAKVLSGKQMWAPLALSDGHLVIRDQSTLKCLDVKTK